MDLLDALQREKHFQLLRKLKDTPSLHNVWLTSSRIDQDLLLDGAPVSNFPVEWLRAMLLHHRGRNTRFEVQSLMDHDGDGAPQDRKRQRDDSDSDSGGDESKQTIAFQIRYVARCPVNETDVYRMLRYPGVSFADETIGEEDDEDLFDLGVLSTSFDERNPQTFASLRSLKKNNLIIAAVNYSNKAALKSIAGVPDDIKAAEREASEEMREFWESVKSPLVLRTVYKTSRRVAEVFYNAMPPSIDDEEELVLEFMKKEGWSSTFDTFKLCVAVSGTFAIGDCPLKLNGKPWINAFAASASFAALSAPIRLSLAAMLKHGDSKKKEESITLKFSIVPVYSPSEDRVAGKDDIAAFSKKISISPVALVDDRVIDESSATAKVPFVFFRRELDTLAPLDPCWLLPRFSPEQNKKAMDEYAAALAKQRQTATPLVAGAKPPVDAATLVPSLRFTRSWWANMSPTVRELLCSSLPVQADIDLSTEAVLMSVRLRNVMTGEEATAEEEKASAALYRLATSSHSSNKRRNRRANRLRNTQVVHYGLNLEEPYDPHFRFNPPLY